MHHSSSSSLDMWQSFPCSCEGKNMFSISPLLSSSDRWTLGEDVGWHTGLSLSSSSSGPTLSAAFAPSVVEPTCPVNWLIKLKMTVPGLWTWTGPTETSSQECTNVLLLLLTEKVQLCLFSCFYFLPLRISHESCHFTHQYPDWLLPGEVAAALLWRSLWGTGDSTPLTWKKQKPVFPKQEHGRHVWGQQRTNDAIYVNPW